MSLRSTLVSIVGLLLAVSLAPMRLAAQDQNPTTGGITGVVVDPNNAIIVHARVILRNNARGTTEQANTNTSGAYQFVLLEPGAYTITVEASGYQVANRQVTVTVGEPILVNFQLAIQVRGVAAPKPKPTTLLQAESGNRSTTLTPQQISELPNPGNDITYLAQIAPGVLMNTESGTGHFSSTGTSTASSSFAINGMNDNEPFLNVNNSGATKLLLGSNEIQEVTVTTENFSGNSGDFGGASVNYVTKSGEGGLHGNVNYLWNGRKLNANSWLNNQAGTARPFDNVNQWSAGLGGALKRNKLFFYFNNEGLHVMVPTSQQVIVPSPQFEGSVVQNLMSTNSEVFYCANGMTVTPPNGIAITCPSSSGVTTDPTNVNLGIGIFKLYNTPPGYANANDVLPPNSFADPFNPNTNTDFTGDGCGTFTGDANFGVSEPNGTPPPTLLPCALAFQSNASNLSTDLLYTGRVDYIFGINDRAFVRYQRDSGKGNVFTDPFLNVFNATSNFSEHQGQLQETHALGNAGVNQFLLAAQWSSHIAQNASQPIATSRFPAQLHFADGSFTDLGGNLSTLPQGRNSTQVQISDDFSRTWGDTTLKVGGFFRRLNVSNHDFGRNTVPFLEVFSLNDFFNGGASGSLLSQSFPLSTDVPMSYYASGMYFEDDWRASQSLAITFAIRGGHDSNPICRYLCFSRLTNDFNRLANGNNGQTLGDCPYNNSPCLTSGGSEGILDNKEQAFPSYQTILWDPRISFAWRPYGGSSKTVVRAGAGLFHELFPAIVADSLASNPPQVNSFTVLNNHIAPSETSGTIPNLFAAAAGANTAFISGFATGQTLSQITLGPSNAGTSFFQPGITVTDRNMRAPEYQKWSLEIQRELKTNTIFSVGIVGTHGIHLPIVNNSANAFGFSNLPVGTVPPSSGPQGAETYPTGLTATFPSGQCSGTSTACTGIDPRFSEVTVISNAGISNYNAAIATFQHRFVKLGNGVVLASYTFSKAHDDVSNGGFLPFNTGETPSLLSPQDPYNFRGSYGPSDFDARHNVSASYVWELPLRQMFGGRGPSRLVNGWQIAGTVFYRTGFPFTVTDQKFSNSFAGNDYFSTILPAALVKVPLTPCTGAAAGTKGKPCLPIASFPLSGQESFLTGFSTGIRNLFRGPNYFNADFSVMKDTTLPGWRRAHLVLGMQAFNVLNHANFDLPVADISNPLFGTIQRQVSSPTTILGEFPGANASARMAQIRAEIRF
jgi:carboxypeptidase family protein